MTMPNEKAAALEEIRRIVERHGLTRDDLAAVIVGPGGPSGRSQLLSRILAVLGAIFVFAGISVFIALNWDVMNRVERVTITLGSGITVFVLALLAEADRRFRRAGPSLFLVAAILQTLGLVVGVDEFDLVWSDHAIGLAICGVMAAQNGVVFRNNEQPLVLFLLSVFTTGFLAIGLDWVGVQDEFLATVIGLSIVGYCIGLDRTRFGSITPFGYLTGSITFYAGLYGLIEATAFELLFVGVAAGGVFLSAIVRSRTLLGTSTLAMLSFIAKFTADHFLDSLGWPLVLVAIGLALIVMSGFALGVDRKYIRSK